MVKGSEDSSDWNFAIFLLNLNINPEHTYTICGSFKTF